MELKSIGLKEAWMRVTSGNKVDSLGDCIMVLPFTEREDAIEFSLRRKTVRFILKDWIITAHQDTEVDLSSGKHRYKFVINGSLPCCFYTDSPQCQ